MPAYGNFVLDKGYDAAVALTKFRYVKFSAEETVTPVTAISDVCVGVAQFDVSAGEITKGKGASVRIEGVSEVESGAAITVGVEVQLTATGLVIAAVGASGARVVGVCLKGCTGANQRVAIRLSLPGRLA